ncbi:MAG: hypothetical protein JWL82_4 [Parcubacteria group bacterium]|nr:hypothetical protein [Parcubacteria group bacterium]
MHDASESRKEISKRLVQAVLEGKPFAPIYYDYVLKLFEVEGSHPVVFWYRWTSTSGYVRSREDPNVFTAIRPDEVKGCDVIFIDYLGTYHTYLDGGLERVKENGARSIQVLTPRVQFGHEDLAILARHADRVLLTHTFLFGMNMLEKLMPGKISLVPSSPDLLPRKLELADRIFWVK